MPAPIVKREREGFTSKTRTISVLTPVFGGGVHLGSEARHMKAIDEITPIRGASVRGQLRFWWRAMYGCQFEVAEMKRIEAHIWGRDAYDETLPGSDKKVTRGPSKVTLRVGAQPSRVPCNVLGDDPWLRGLRGSLRQGLEYAAFPLRSEQKGQPDGSVTRLQGEADITLTVDTNGLSQEQVDSVWHALDAWIHFGGIGGRTRRGFGAIETSATNIDALLRKACTPLDGTGVPNLGAARYVLGHGSFQTPLEAWAFGLERFKAMRQGLGVGRHKKRGETGWKAAGRSNWPEPDEIRRLTRQTASGHRTPVTEVRAMPRAAFGMPIIFHFKTYGDPKDTTLKPRGAQRLASPLIIRPTKVGDRYRAMALVLGGSRADDLVVELDAGRRADIVSTRLTRQQASTGRLARPLQGQPDPLQAFLDFISKDPRA